MATYIIGGALLGIVFLICANLYKKRKNGSSCSSGCSSCPHSGHCK